MSENERLAKVETTIESIEKALNRLESKLDILNENMDRKFVPRPEVESSIKRLHDRIDELNEDMHTVQTELTAIREKQGRVPAWAAALITFLISAIGFVIEFLKH
jgi:chromosome segregation ATPase